MRRLVAITILLASLGVGSGTLAYIHEAAHIAAGEQQGDGCDICVQLHMPVISSGWTPLLVCLGLFIAFLTLLTPLLISQPVRLAISCRGPPACRSFSLLLSARLLLV